MLVTENTQKHDDAVNKLKVLEGDLERVYERLTNAQNKVDRLEDEAKQVNTDLKDLETKDEEASQREMSMEDQARYLDSQHKETEQRADQAERMAARLERLRDTIIGTFSSYWPPLSPFFEFFSHEQAKTECDWVVMSSVFVASQSSCFFHCSREQILLVENRF